MPECKGCGSKIEFKKMNSGKWNPVDPEPLKVVVKDEKTGNHVVVTGYISHYATCPVAERFRKG